MELEKEIKQKMFRSEFQKVVVNIEFTRNWMQSKVCCLLKDYDLTQPQYNVLRILRGQHPNPATVNLLIDRMLDKSSNASRIVERLKNKGLVVRHECAHDRRSVDVIITDEGLTLLKEIDPVISGMDVDLKQSLDEEEARVLNNLLDKLRG